MLTVATAGNASTLVKVGESGTVQSVVSRITLDPLKQEVYSRSFRIGNNTHYANVITAAGFSRINEKAGVSFVAPDRLAGHKPGEMVANPYFHWSEDGQLEYVRVRRVGFGMNSIGTMTAIDLTVTYNVLLYFVTEVWAKWNPRYSPNAQTWARLYSSAAVPLDARDHPQVSIVDCPGNVSLALDLRTKEVRNLLMSHGERQNFADRNAITICERNILKKFFGFSVAGQDLAVEVVSWPQASDVGPEDMEKLARHGPGILGLENVQTGSEEVTYDDASTLVDVDEETAPPEEAVVQEQAPPTDSVSLNNIRRKIRHHLAGFQDSEDVVRRCTRFGTVAEMSACSDLDTLIGCAQALSKERMRNEDQTFGR